MPKEKPWKFQVYEGSAEDIEFKLTPQSMELFEQGLPAQGYIGLLELETGKVHLVPSFNYSEELREINKVKDEHGVLLDNKEAYKSWTHDIDYMQNKDGEFFHATSDSGKAFSGKKSFAKVLSLHEELATKLGAKSRIEIKDHSKPKEHISNPRS